MTPDNLVIEDPTTVFTLKTSRQALIEEKLIKQFKNGRDYPLSIFYRYYLNPVGDTLKKEIDDLLAEEIKNEVVYTRLRRRRAEISDICNLQRVIFEEVACACSARYKGKILTRIGKELNALQNIFFKIEDLPEEQRYIAKNRLEKNSEPVIPQQPYLPDSQIPNIVRKIKYRLIAEITNEREEKANILLDLFQERFLRLLI